MSEALVESRTTTRTGWGPDLGVAAAAATTAAVTWLLWTQGVGAHLTVPAGDSTREVGIVPVVVTSLFVTLLAAGLLRVLVAHTRRGLRTWSIVAVTVLLLSFVGPLGASTSEAVLGLASLHLVVGVVVVLGLRQVRRAWA